jgi:hypothetical protein
MNSNFHANTKHVKLDVYYLKDLVWDDIVELKFNRSEEQE